MDISTLIRQERKNYVTEEDNLLVHHDEINNGVCRLFARYFRACAAEHGIEVTLYQSGFDCYGVPAHAWIEYNENCYDADCPEGVSEPIKLPYYQNKDVDALPSKQKF